MWYSYTSSAIHVNVDANDLPHSKPGWIGVRRGEDVAWEYGDELSELSVGDTGMGPSMYTQEQVDALVGKRGFRYVPWLGWLTIPIVDSKRQIIALLGGQPRDKERWKVVVNGAASEMEQREERIHLSAHEYQHRRAQDEYAALTRGPSFGTGQMEPGELHTNPTNTQITGELMHHRFFLQIVGFTVLLMSLYAPRLLTRYQKCKDDLLAWKQMRWNFDTGVHAASGWCPVTALGDYNPDLGGHIILWELRLIIRFPPGSTIFIPLAIITHSNTPIQPHKKRHSFTQFTSGLLFRWVANGNRTDDEFLASASPEEKAERDKAAGTRWEDGLSYFMTLDELESLYKTQ
ncbi:hypothetical protein FB45DRAFT_1082366 [Roridomyces roridus]|uniref:Uncharacterized protein n=1 Tax=Roridomyces roridus TaxID=1738132 RepID=A0AAD7FJE0_9AGAR|nr:hypothetical protein FB45DRAFT_1082366 [Roridomyces roridus]